MLNPHYKIGAILQTVPQRFAMADSQVSEKTVTLTDNSTGKSVTLPVNAGSIGPQVIDIRNLYAMVCLPSTRVMAPPDHASRD